MTYGDQRQFITETEYDPETLPEEYSQQLKGIIASMLIRDPRLRPDTDNSLKNVFKTYRISNKSPNRRKENCKNRAWR